MGGSAPTGGCPSPGFARTFLGFLETEMNHYQSYLRAKFDEVSKLEPTLESARKAALSKIKDQKGGLFDKKKGILEHLQGKVQPACDNYYKRRIDKKILEISVGFANEVLDFLRDRIRNLDQFTNKLAQLKRTLSEAEKVLTFDTQGLNLNGELLYEPGEVEAYYNQFVADADRKSNKNTPSLVAEGTLSSLSASTPYELGSDSYRNKDIISLLVEKSRPFFSPLNEISVARKFLDRYPGEDQALLALRNVFNSSEVFLTFKQIPDFSVLPNSRVSLIGIFGGQEPTLPDYASLLPLLSKCGDGVAQLKGVQPIRGKHEILFTIEEGAFPLRRINEIDAYEAAYDRYMRSDNLNPLHLRKNEEDYLLEIGLPPLEEQRKARVACLLGIALGVIVKDEDDPRFLIYRYVDERTGLSKSRPVGRVGEEEKVAESLLSRFNKDLRELIYKEVLTMLGRARGEAKEKEQIWRSLVQYREDLFTRKPKDLADRYSSEVIEPLIEEYQLFDKSFMKA
ncbi:MAG: hypothetical protein HYU64_08570 [Armatimonadetes bacterium]|nr:hypothetical protein [Armatimonadota bacterium]